MFYLGITVPKRCLGNKIFIAICTSGNESSQVASVRRQMVRSYRFAVYFKTLRTVTNCRN